MVIPKNSSLKVLKENSLGESKLKYFYVPQSLYEVGFANVRLIEKIEIHPNNRIFAFKNACFMNYNQEIVFYCFNTNPNVVIHIPETVFGIESYSFLLTYGKTIIFPKILTWIHQFAFLRCQVPYYDFSKVLYVNELPLNGFELSKIKIFDFSNVTNIHINHRAFICCYNLEIVTISPACIYIGLDSFKFCSRLKKIIIPPDSKLQRIVNSAFAYTNLAEFIITPSIQFIGLNAFEGVPHVVLKCDPNNWYFTVKDSVLFFDKSSILIWYPPYLRNETYQIPSHANTLRSYCFYKAIYLKELIFPVQLTKILQHAVYCTNITAIKLPPLVSNIEMYAFANNRMLESIDFGDSIKLIPKFVVADCVNLKYIYIPPSVTYIRQKAFENCRSLQCISCGKNLVNILSQQVPLRIIRVDNRCSASDNEIIVL
ncbi:choline binding protein, putative [Trichomonas vaginalis G3]|uniref:Choline binding protein, putative n=1 Tax=Trichomonas vaginalis (strain ATCC PRA-98 / G3) TaxID=412133 RepID=A2ELP9_TRIV3|nr:ribonuclease inhibitor domain-containing protein [Trichomonas vaginalis G3]EAY06414.1 choline binding protein, putative [Trichomonas vaginalis G3]KAI5503002.1 ribonuclease inhibitor domain-containing protein [Trichomonas vaginalis G3]|eukprot:XP_001318637.1 choline binding protein [Trichomonas vaginalis G3]